MKKFLPLLLVAVACTTTYPYRDLDRLVVEGWIDAGGAPVIMVTSPLPASDKQVQAEDLIDHLYYKAYVSVKDEDTGEETTLTPRKDSRYFPPIIYTTDQMKGVASHRYSLKVMYGNHVAKAVTRIPEPVPLDRVEVSRSEQSDTMYVVTAYFNDPDGYHRFFAKVEGQDSMYLPSLLSGQMAANRAGAVSVMRGYGLYNRHWKPLYKLGETVHIKFCTVEEDIWAYWDSFDAVSTIATVGFFPITSNPPTNMKGAYGYWAGYGATYATVKVELP